MSGTAEIGQLRAASEVEWREVLSDPRVRKALEEAKIDTAVIPGSGAFEIRTGSSGFDVAGADIVIAVGG